jgi:hypothetical protein
MKAPERIHRSFREDSGKIQERFKRAQDDACKCLNRSSEKKKYVAADRQNQRTISLQETFLVPSTLKDDEQWP